jgi:acetylcholinesterase
MVLSISWKVSDFFFKRIKLNQDILGDLVLVTVQFRLGVFGYLALEHPDIPGNAALKDQNLALKWVKRNIKRFGGDPNQVTLAGASSGASAVTAHMLSPMSKDLFHNVIAASGALPWQKHLKRNNILLARNLAEKVRCDMETIDLTIECLEFVSVKNCLRSQKLIVICRFLQQK